MSDVLLRVDGEVVDAEDCTWLFVGPCGCGYGATIAFAAAPYSHSVLTEDAAWREMYENAEERRRHRAEGCTVRLIHRRQITDLLMTKCPHEPQWGMYKAPVPEGYTWAGVSSSLSKGNARTHLVPGPSEKQDDYLCDWRNPLNALCGKQSPHWRNSWWATDAPTCRRCEKIAQAMADERVAS